MKPLKHTLNTQLYVGILYINNSLATIKPVIAVMYLYKCSRCVWKIRKQNTKDIYIYFFCILDYAAVLTGHGISNAATGRFYFRKKTLQYSFLMGEQLGWPDELTFLDRDDNILEDFTVSKTSLQNQTDKLCGAWERLPRKYRRLLRSEELSIRNESKLLERFQLNNQFKCHII